MQKAFIHHILLSVAIIVTEVQFHLYLLAGLEVKKKLLTPIFNLIDTVEPPSAQAVSHGLEIVII